MEQKMEIEEQAGKEGRAQPTFDEMPVGRRSNTNSMFAEEHPPGYVDQPAVQEELPLDKRLASKIWKLRQSALDELIAKCQVDPEYVGQFESQFLSMLADSNVNCQDKAFKLLEAYLGKKQRLSTEAKPVLKNLIEKGLSANKQEIVRQANHIIIDMFDKGYATEVYAALAQGLMHKNPKLPASCVQLYTHLLTNFGLKKLDMLKPIFRELQPYLQTTSITLKNAILAFYKEAFKWLGEGLAAFSVKLKKPLSEELQKFTKSYVRTAMVPLRQNESEAQQLATKKVVDVDVYDLADPVDAINKFDESWTNKVLQIPKWSDKKDVLDAAIQQLSVPKLVPRQHYHLLSFLKKLLSDSNIAIQICAMKMCKALASGLRKSFAHGAKVLAPLLISKLRDKKNQITEQAHRTIKALFHSIGLEDLIEPIKEGLADKAPNMRIQVLKLLENTLGKKDMKTMKVLLDPIVKLATDGAVEVRDKFVELISEIKNAYGVAFFGDKLRDIQSQKLQKILSQRTEPKVEMKSEHVEVVAKYVSNHSQSYPQLPSHSIPSQQISSSSLSFKSIPQPKSQDIGNANEAVRLQAYQSLIQRPPSNCFLMLRSKCIKESSPNILRAILTLMQRCAPELTREHIEFLLLHDWRKAKHFLSDYLQTARMSPDCAEVLRQSTVLREIMTKEPAPQKPKQPLIPQLHSLIPNIMNFLPQAKLQGCDAMLALVEQYKGVEADYSVSTKQINEICNVIKCRIADSDPEVVKRFIALARAMTRTGIVNKTRGRVLLPAILQKICDQTVYLDVLGYMSENLELHPGYLFSHLPTMLLQDELRLYLLSFLESNLTPFIKTADMKSFLPALFSCLVGPPDIAVKAERLLDTIVELQGEGFLEKSVRELKIYAPESYLLKWGIEKTKAVPEGFSGAQPSYPAAQPIRLSKSQRLREEPSNPWPLVPSPSHILQLLSVLPQLPAPFPELNTLLPVTARLIAKVCESPLLHEHSDIVVKWLFWRFQIERKEGVLSLLDLAKKMVALGLEEIELIILLAGLLGVVNLGEEVMARLCDLHRMFKPADQQKVFRFWVNLIKDSSVHVDEILKILRVCFHDTLRSELVELASYPAVRTNKDFLKYLTETYDLKTLQVYGFDVEEKALKRSLSMVADENSPNHLEHLVASFKRKDLSEVLGDVAREVYQKSPEFTLDFHSALLQALAPSLVKQEIKPPIFIGYISYFTKELSNLPTERQAAAIARYLVFLLMDLDEMKPLGHNEVIRVVNSAMLKLLEITPMQPMIEAMFGLVREQMTITPDYNKTVAVMCKCICKLVKGANFYAKGNLDWLLEEILSIFDQCYMNYSKPESAIHKVFKAMVNDAITNKPLNENAIGVLKTALERHSANTFSTQLFGDLVEPKAPAEPSKEEILLNRLNLIKVKCGVDELSNLPNVWSKKKAD